MTTSYTTGIRLTDVRPMTDQEIAEHRAFVARQDSMLRDIEALFPLRVILGGGTYLARTGPSHAVSDGRTACGIPAAELYELRHIPFTTRDTDACRTCMRAITS